MQDTVVPFGNQSDVIRFLSEPSTYGSTAPVERHETHGAIVFLCGGYAYKLKRAGRYPYMDYSTAEKRRMMCERELAVNRRTAPVLYLRVQPIMRDATGKLSFGDHGEGRVIDWVVVMRRFAQDALLETMRQRQELTLSLMRTLAEQIASFHEAAERQAGLGGGKGIGNVIAGDVEVFQAMAGHPFLPQKLERLARLAWRRLGRDCELLDRRRDTGFVRRCHGDLHLNNICLIDGEPVLFDAIEFDERFSCIDVLYDLAFLLMDLDRHRLHEHANTVLNRYLEKTRDYGGLAALPLFLSCRAAIRAHVTVSAARASAPLPEDDRLKEAEALFDRAIDYLAPASPRLIAVGGLSGTGKSTLARSIAPVLGIAPGAIVLRSDLIRKQLAGIREDQHLPAAAYSMEMNARVYERIAETATQVIQAGYSAIADAVYGTTAEQDQIAAVASKADVPFSGLWLTAAQPLLEQRIEARRGDASDATVDVLRQQLTRVQEPAAWGRIDANVSGGEAAANALDRLRTRSL
jgi:uncharacterized protein